MSTWKKLYTAIDRQECIGNSLPKINKNFYDIDYYISQLPKASFFNQFLVDSENLADVDDKDISRINLGYGTASDKSSSVGAKAWGVIGRDGTIYNSYNIASVDVTYTGSGHGEHWMQINYTTPLTTIGPIMCSGGYNGSTRISEIMVRARALGYCQIQGREIDYSIHGAHYNEDQINTPVCLVVY